MLLAYKENNNLYLVFQDFKYKEEDIIINNTRLVSNPWGYDTKEFKIKTLTLTK